MHPKEKEFADLLTKQGRKWIYHYKSFSLGHTSYEPDFYLPKENLYIEVVGNPSSLRNNARKIMQFKRVYSKIKFIIVNYKGIPISIKRKYKRYIYT